MSNQYKPGRRWKLRVTVCAFGRLAVASAPGIGPAPGRLVPTAAGELAGTANRLVVSGRCPLPQARVATADELAVIVAFGSHAPSVLRKAAAADNLADWAALARAAYHHPGVSGRDLTRLTWGRSIVFVAKALHELGRIKPMTDDELRDWLKRAEKASG